MAVPLSYNLRNLWVRKTTTLMTALGIGLTVAVLLGILGMLAGLQQSFQTTGNPLQLIVMRQGSTAEMTSAVSREQFQILRAKEGMATDEKGEPMISHELITVVNLPLRGQEGESNVNVRGLGPMGVRMRSDIVKLHSGRWFAPGQRELTIGKGVSETNANALVGSQLQVGRGFWTVVGIFDGGATAFNGEIWGDANQLGTDAGRTQTLSSALLRARDPAAAQSLTDQITHDQRLNHQAKSEAQYYLEQTESGRPLQYLGTFVAVIMAIGSVFAAMNTMYAAVARRTREIGVLKVLGFSRGSIMFSFMVESLLLSLLGGALACLLAFPFNGLSSRIGNSVTFSQMIFQFRITPQMLAAGLAFAALMGLFGGLWPARDAARKDALNALRDI